MSNKGKVQFITDPRPGFGPAEQVEMVCAYGVDWVQLRMKNASRDEKMEHGRKAAEIAGESGAVFIVNDDVDLAHQLSADGIHLGLADEDPIVARKFLGEEAIIGGTCNSMDDIRLRKRQGVDYIGLGPYRYTSTKKKLSPILGLQGMIEIMQQWFEEQIDIPIVAIGGIRIEDIKQLRKTGVHGIALSSLIVNANDMEAQIRKIQEKML